eukprot:gene19260-23289_t
MITFNSLAGDLPMLYATPGRLTPLDSQVAIKVKEVVKGTPAVLSYDVSTSPAVRTTTIKNLVPGSTYSFKVLPMNALGMGILSAPSTTVYASSGASAIFTTASGSSLNVGITYDVDEEQTLDAYNCRNSSIQLFHGSKYVNVSLAWSSSQIASALETIVDGATIEVTHF